MRSMPRDRRRHEQATSTAVAPNAILTVRAYGAARPPYGPELHKSLLPAAQAAGLPADQPV